VNVKGRGARIAYHSKVKWYNDDDDDDGGGGGDDVDDDE
jgi:hypothetical protein